MTIFFFLLNTIIGLGLGFARVSMIFIEIYLQVKWNEMKGIPFWMLKQNLCREITLN